MYIIPLKPHALNILPKIKKHINEKRSILKNLLISFNALLI